MPHAPYKLIADIRLSIEETIPEYRSIIGLRNIIAHGYDVVDPMMVWDVVVNHVPKLSRQIDTYS